MTKGLFITGTDTDVGKTAVPKNLKTVPTQQRTQDRKSITLNETNK